MIMLIALVLIAMNYGIVPKQFVPLTNAKGWLPDPPVMEQFSFDVTVNDSDYIL